MSVELFKRLDPVELNPAQLAPLESALPSDWPAIWRELATSHYVTLISAPSSDSVDRHALVQLAMALALGVASDLGGSQPYIPVGSALMINAKARKVVELLNQKMSYREVSVRTGLTVQSVRRIELEWRKQQRKLLQGVLDLE